MKWFYEVLYGRLRAPWDIGPRKELVELVESGCLKPGTAIDLGSGTASNCVFLAQHGFEVTGVDFAQAAIDLGNRRAADATVSVNFIRDDLTNLQNVRGTFDLLIDYGTLDDLKPSQRERYLQNVLPLTHAGSRFLLFCFEWKPRWYERPYFSSVALLPGEAERRFAPHFDIERYAGENGSSGFPRGWAVYLMTRKEVP
jgi:cyclopropane fatty-acyl-phospholipid synthase-like methyltransferase